MDETYIKVAGKWKYLYRAVDRAGDTVDFLLTAKARLGCCSALSGACHQPATRSRVDHNRQ